MRKQILLIACVVFSGLLLSSCWWGHDTSISMWDNEDEYEMNANYAKSKTRRVQRLIDSRLEENFHRSFDHNLEDEEIVLDDRTRFHIHSNPGELEIIIDKTQNSEESLIKIKELCEDIKELLEHH